MARVRLLVSGRVQGVGYRWFAREEARALAVRGWVRNMPDGTVEIAASAADDTLTRFVERLRAGPPGANVAGIRELADPGDDLPDPFTIRR